MDLSNSRDRNTFLRSRSALLKRFVLTAFLLLAAWVPQAFATTGCEIFTTGPVTATVNPSSPQSFSVILQDTGGGPCTPTNLNFSVSGPDTTGGVILPANITGATFTPTGSVYSFSVTAGPNGGGSAIIQVDCSTCFPAGGSLSVQFTLNTNNVFVLSPTTATSITTNQSTPFTLGTNLTVNGGPGFGYQTNFLALPSGPSIGTPTNDAGGNASVTATANTVGTRNIQATTVCPVAVVVPGCPGNSVGFTVIVEAVAMTPVSAVAVSIPAGSSTTTIARYGSTNSVVNPGYPVTWAVTTNPGDGALSGATNTDGIGHTQATFTATVPGVYVVTASTGDTWSGDSTESFTITVTAIVRTLAISSGDGQSAPTGTALPSPLVVLAQDNAVNAPGITINWSVQSGDAAVTAPTSVTGAGGLANIGVNLGPTPGPIVITATRADDTSVAVSFNITSTLTRTLVIVSGNGQNATPGSPLANPLVVNAKNNGISTNGVTINWTITPGSTLGAPSNVTAGGGAASNTVTVSPTPGVVTITATRQDDPTVFVTFTANGVTLAGIPGLKPNQRRMAGALDTICTGLNALPSPTPQQQDFIDRCQELADNAASNPGDVIEALDELMPDTQAAQARASMLTASRQFENINARIAALRSGTQGSSFGGLALQGSNGSISLGSLINGLSEEKSATEVGADFQRWGFFASGTIGSGDSKDAGVTPSFDFDIHGLTLGVDYRKSDKFIFGAAIGYTNQDTDLAPGQGGVDASGYTLSAYGTFFQSNSWYTDAVVTFGKNNYDLTRQITYIIPDGLGGFTTVDQTARSDSGGDLMSFGATFGRDFQKGGWSIGPYGRVLYTRMNFDRIEETLIDSGPGAGLALIVEERSLDSLATILGGKFTRAISTNWGVLSPHFQLEWEHEYNSDPSAATARFVNDPTGTEIELVDAPYDADFFRIGVGLSAILTKGRSGFLYYEKTIGREGVSQDNLALGFRMEF